MEASRRRAKETIEKRYGPDYWKKLSEKGIAAGGFNSETAKAAYEKGLGKKHKAQREARLRMAEAKKEVQDEIS